MTQILTGRHAQHNELNLQANLAHKHGCMLAGKQNTYMIYKQYRLSVAGASLAELTVLVAIRVNKW